MAEVSSSGYGKNSVRLLRVRRDGECHSVCELRVNVELELASKWDYQLGDNRDVVATDSQKNTVLVFAQKNAIESPEQFAMMLSQHFLATYKQVLRCQIYIEQTPWSRVKQGGAEHGHAFICEPSCIRFCLVSQQQGGKPEVYGGLRDMKVMKTTQSGFEGFVRDQFTTLPEVNDRVFCTKVYCKYKFDRDTYGVDFNSVWTSVQQSALDVFAGPPHGGTYSPSVQKTMFDTAETVFSRQPHVSTVEIHMPNIHYYEADLSKLRVPNNAELFLPSEEPHGMITATFSRVPRARL